MNTTKCRKCKSLNVKFVRKELKYSKSPQKRGKVNKPEAYNITIFKCLNCGEYFKRKHSVKTVVSCNVLECTYNRHGICKSKPLRKCEVERIRKTER